MRPGFARDQYGEPWIIFERDQDLWALGMNGDFPVLCCLYGSSTVQLNLDKPRALRDLVQVEERLAETVE